MIFEFNDAQILFGMFQGFKKVTLLGGAKKLRLTLPPVRHVDIMSRCGNVKNRYICIVLSRGP